MTTKDQKERLEVYRTELQHSREHRKRHYEEGWKKYRAMYAHRDPLYCGADGKPRVQVNYIHSNLNVIMDSTLHRFPKITASARNAESFERSVIVEHALNQQWQTKGWQEPHRLAFLDKLIYGHGWTKTTYQFEYEETQLSDEEFEAKFNEEMKAAIAVATEGKRAWPKEEEIRSAIKRKGVNVLKDEVQVERVSPLSMFVDPYATTMKGLRWIAQEVVERRSTFLRNEAFSASVRKSLGGGRAIAGGNGIFSDAPSLAAETVPEQLENDRGMTSDLVRYVEFYDLERGELSFFLSEGDGGEYLIDPAPFPYAFGHPFDMLRGNEVPDRFYPMGEVEILADTQRELNELRSDILDQRKRNSRQWAYKPAHVTEDFEEIMRNGSDEVLLPVDSDAPLSDIIAELPSQARVNPMLYDMTGLLTQDMQQLSGINDFQRGGGATTRTATQVAVENDGALARQGRQLHALETAMANTARHALMLMQQFMQVEGIIRISNIGRHVPETEGVEQRAGHVWYTYHREDIGGNYDIKIEAGSTRPMNDSTRAQNALQLANIALPFVQTGVVKQSELATYLLREMGVPNPESWVEGGVDPRSAQQQVPPTPGSVEGGVAPVGAGVGPERQGGLPPEGARPQLEQQVGLN